MMVRLFTLSTFVLSLFLLVGSQPVCSQNWDIVSTLDNYEAEGWYIYRPPRTEATLTQNADGTVTITRLNQNSSTIYMTHDVAWDESNGFTYEFRVRVDAIGGQWGGTDEHWDRASIYPLKNNPDGTWPTFSNGRTWLCSFDQTSIGSRYFANPFLPKADVDFTQFHVITFVCELDEGILADKLANEPDVSYGDSFDEGVIGRALGDHSPWSLYVDPARAGRDAGERMERMGTAVGRCGRHHADRLSRHHPRPDHCRLLPHRQRRDSGSERTPARGQCIELVDLLNLSILDLGSPSPP